METYSKRPRNYDLNMYLIVTYQCSENYGIPFSRSKMEIKAIKMTPLTVE